MQVIWKQQLYGHTVQEISVPVGAEILCAHAQFENVCIWYKCDNAAPKETRKIACLLTDQAAPEDGRYVGTVFLRGGVDVLHVFAWPK